MKKILLYQLPGFFEFIFLQTMSEDTAKQWDCKIVDAKGVFWAADVLEGTIEYPTALVVPSIINCPKLIDYGKNSWRPESSSK